MGRAGVNMQRPIDRLAIARRSDAIENCSHTPGWGLAADRATDLTPPPAPRYWPGGSLKIFAFFPRRKNG